MTIGSENCVVVDGLTYANAEYIFNEIIGDKYDIVCDDTRLVATKKAGASDTPETPDTAQTTTISVGNATTRKGKEIVVPISILCRNHNASVSDCPNTQISEKAVYEAFTQMYNRLVKNKEYILDRMLKQLKDLKEVRHKHNKEFHNITEEISNLTGQILSIEKLNSRGYLEPALYHEKKGVLNSQIVELKKERKQMSGRDECSEAIRQTEKICDYIEKNGSIKGFDEKAFKSIVKRIIAKNNILTFELKNGMKLKVETE